MAHRYIDAEAIPYRTFFADGHKSEMDFIRRYEVDAMPTADVAEVIRCKDCGSRSKYKFPPKYDERDYCEVHQQVVAATDYCSWATKMDEVEE